MAGTKNHDYHILPPSIMPLFGSIAALTMTSGGVLYMHKMAGGGAILLAGFAAVLFTMYSWWSSTIKEAHAGDHTPVVQLHLRYGMIR
jgi:cytochrome c oxidase subunit 3